MDLALLEPSDQSREPVFGKWYAVVCFALGLTALGMGVSLLAAGSLFTESLSVVAKPKMLIGGVNLIAVGVALIGLGLISLKFFAGRGRPALRLTFASFLALVCLLIGTAAFASAIGMAISIPFVGDLPYSESEVSMGLWVGIMTNFGAGSGLIALGIVILRIFNLSGNN